MTERKTKKTEAEPKKTAPRKRTPKKQDVDYSAQHQKMRADYRAQVAANEMAK